MLQSITDDLKDPGDLYTKDNYYADGKAVQDSQTRHQSNTTHFYISLTIHLFQIFGSTILRSIRDSRMLSR